MLLPASRHASLQEMSQAPVFRIRARRIVFKKSGFMGQATDKSKLFRVGLQVRIFTGTWSKTFDPQLLTETAAYVVFQLVSCVPAFHELNFEADLAKIPSKAPGHPGT